MVLLLLVACALASPVPPGVVGGAGNGNSTPPAAKDEAAQGRTDVALDVVTQELAETRKLAGVLARRAEILDRVRGLLLGSNSSLPDASVRQLLLELQSHPMRLSSEARRLGALASPVAGHAPSRTFGDMFVPGPRLTANEPVAVMLLPLSMSGVPSRSGRRRQPGSATASTFCIITVSHGGSLEVHSASGVVVASHALWGPPDGTEPTVFVTSASLGGDYTPHVVAAGSDGRVRGVELTVFVDGQRVLGRSAFKKEADARAPQEADAAGGEGPTSRAAAGAPTAAEGASIAEAAVRPDGEVTAEGVQNGGKGASAEEPAGRGGEAAGAAAPPAAASDARARQRHPDAPAGLGISCVLVPVLDARVHDAAAAWLVERVVAAWRDLPVPLPWDWCPEAAATAGDEDGGSSEARCAAPGDVCGASAGGGSPPPRVVGTTVDVYRLRGITKTVVGDSWGGVTLLDVGTGGVDAVLPPSPETHPSLAAWGSNDEAMEPWLRRVPIGARLAAQAWLAHRRATGAGVPPRCGCAPRPSPGPACPVGAAAAAMPLATRAWSGVTAVSRQAAHVIVARAHRVSFATAGNLHETGAVCESPLVDGASPSSGGARPSDVVSAAMDAADPRFLWAGTRSGDVLVFDTRAPVGARGRRQPGSAARCRLAHRFVLSQGVLALAREAAAGPGADPPAAAGEEDAGPWHSPGSAALRRALESGALAASVATTRGYALVASAAGVFLFNSSGIVSATPALVVSRSARPDVIQGLLSDASASPGRRVVGPSALLSPIQVRGSSDPTSAWMLPSACQADAAPCFVGVHTASLLLPPPPAPPTGGLGWMRFPAIGIVVIVVFGYQVASKGASGTARSVWDFLRRLGRLLGVVTGDGSASGKDRYSAASLSAMDKERVMEMIRQGQMDAAGMGGGGIRDPGAAGLGGMGGRAGRAGGGGGFDRRAEMEALHREAEVEHLLRRHGTGAYGGGAGLGGAEEAMFGGGGGVAEPMYSEGDGDDEPIAQWLE